MHRAKKGGQKGGLMSIEKMLKKVLNPAINPATVNPGIGSLLYTDITGILVLGGRNLQVH